MAKETRITSMTKQSKQHIEFLENRKAQVQEQVDLISAEITVKQSAKKELNHQIKSLDNDIAEECKLLEKLEA